MANKKKTLDDFLKMNKKPPTKGKKAPPDYDVITPDMGYTKPTKKNAPKKFTPSGKINSKTIKQLPKKIKKK